MVKKIPSQEENQPFDYFANERTTQKRNALPSVNVVNKLRGDMLPSTEALPTKGSVFLRINLKIVLGVLLTFILFGLIIFSVSGAGRERLEKSLFGLYGITKTPTRVSTQTTLDVITIPRDTTQTPTSKPTSIPIKTPTAVVRMSPTPLLPLATFVIPIIPSQTPSVIPSTACRDVGTITLTDVGQTLCVQGVVRELIAESTNFMVIFNSEKGAFYWVTYDMVWSEGEVDQCYQLSGKIDQIANSPVLVFNYNNIPVECPK
jgi:hypothetical protein